MVAGVLQLGDIWLLQELAQLSSLMRELLMAAPKWILKFMSRCLKTHWLAGLSKGRRWSQTLQLSKVKSKQFLSCQISHLIWTQLSMPLIFWIKKNLKGLAPRTGVSWRFNTARGDAQQPVMSMNHRLYLICYVPNTMPKNRKTMYRHYCTFNVKKQNV